MRAVRRTPSAWVPEKQLGSVGLDVLFAYRDTNSTQFTTCITESGAATAHITSFSPNCYCFVQYCS